MKTKDQVQEEARTAIKENRGRGIIAMATGTGKSKVAIDHIAEKHKSNFDLNVLIVVPTEKLRDVNWRDEFVKWDQEYLWNNNVERSCYASISKLRGGNYDIVILDEGHNITPNNSEFFENNVVGDVIVLTATPPVKLQKVEILNKLGLFVIYSVSLDQAVEWGLVSPYKITVVYTTLDSVRRYIKSGNAKKVFYVNEFNAYYSLSNLINHTASGSSKYQALILKRMRIIYNSIAKQAVAQFLLDKVIPKDQRTLIFAGSIEQAETLCSDTFHSKSNDEKYNQFLNKEIDRLSSVQSLNEGQNIPDLDNALIVQANSSDLNMIQRIGRIVRYRDEHIADIYVIALLNTVDIKWLESSLSGFDKTKIEYVKFGDLKMRYT